MEKSTERIHIKKRKEESIMTKAQSLGIPVLTDSSIRNRKYSAVSKSPCSILVEGFFSKLSRQMLKGML